MSRNEVHSQVNVPFAWENKPGVSKLKQQEYSTEIRGCSLTLPPPPCLTGSSNVFGHDHQIPLSPSPFQSTPSRKFSIKGLRRQEDPFLAAYKECTKSVKNSKLPNDGKRGGGSVLRKSALLFSCRYSCVVRDDCLVRLSHLPTPVLKERPKEAN